MRWLWAHLMALIAAVGAVATALAYRRGRAAATADRDAEVMEAEYGARAKIDQIVRDTDGDTAREWLRDRGSR